MSFRLTTHWTPAEEPSAPAAEGLTVMRFPEIDLEAVARVELLEFVIAEDGVKLEVSVESYLGMEVGSVEHFDLGFVLDTEIRPHASCLVAAAAVAPWPALRGKDSWGDPSGVLNSSVFDVAWNYLGKLLAS